MVKAMAIGAQNGGTWALSIPYSNNPILDPTGDDGDLNQKGPVWFLAGTFGTHAERSVKVPRGKAIFFPLTNIWNDYPCPDPNFKPAPGQSMYDFLAAGAAFYIDPWVNDPSNLLSAKVDGVELKHLLNYRAISKLTRFTGDISNTAIDPCITGSKQVGVSDGIWITLEPLKKGDHTIEFSAYSETIFAPFIFDLNVIYHLTVE